MPNVAAILKEEIVRLARKEIKREQLATRKFIARQRKDIADLKQRVAQLKRDVGAGARRQRAAAAPDEAGDDGPRIRFSAKGLQSLRSRLGLSANDFAKLVGVSSQSVYNWEHEHSSPRASQLAALAALRKIGKREAQARLEQVAAQQPPARRRRTRKA